jgi:hypothetical protein
MRRQVVAITHDLYVECMGMKARQQVEIRHNERTEIEVRLATFSRQELLTAQSHAQRAQRLDRIGLAATVASGGFAALQFVRANNSFNEALAIDDTGVSGSYEVLWEQGTSHRQSAFILSSVTVSSLVFSAVHRAWVTKRLKAEVEHMEEVMNVTY